jgi:hypothetical protein
MKGSAMRGSIGSVLAIFTLLCLVGGHTLVGQVVAGRDKPSTDAADDQTIVLFDGSDLSHWRGYKQEEIGKGWKVVDGVLKFDGSGGGDITTKQEFDNFELTFDWKVEKGSNSGVMYRVSLGDGAPYLSGPEYQVLDDDVHNDGKNPLTSAGSIYALYAPKDKKLNPVGEWNSAKIVLNGNHLEHWLNGTLVAETEIHGDDWNQRREKSKFRDWEKFGMNASGHICLQDHGDVVYYRDIRVKPLVGK